MPLALGVLSAVISVLGIVAGFAKIFIKLGAIMENLSTCVDRLSDLASKYEGLALDVAVLKERTRRG